MNGGAETGARQVGGSGWAGRVAAVAAGAAGLGCAGHFLAQCARAAVDVLRLATPDAVRLVTALAGYP